MARPAMPVGTYSTKIEAKPEVQKEDGTYGAAPAGTSRRQIARWRARGSVRTWDGRSVKVTRFGKSKTEAEGALRQAMEQMLTSVEGEELKPTTTVADAATFWLKEAEKDAEKGNVGKGRRALSVGTLRVYRLAVEKHIVGTAAEPGAIASLRLQEVTAPRLERAIVKVAEGSGAGMAKTVRSVYRHIFALAVYQSAIRHNPLADVRPLGARVEQAADDNAGRKAFTEAELAKVLETAQTNKQVTDRDLSDLIHFLAGTGLRIGEALAVRWEDVDLADGAVRVGGTTVQRIKGKGLAIVNHGRTKLGTRLLPLPASVVERLKARQVRLGGMDNPYGVVFPAVLSGNLRDPSNTAHHIKDLMVAAGLPWATAHTFRKTVVTTLHRSGLADVDVSNYVGHARVSTTQNYYLDRKMTAGHKAASVLDGVFSAPSPE